MSFSDTAENDLLQLLFNNVDMALVGDATGLRGASAAGSFYLSLHTARADSRWGVLTHIDCADRVHANQTHLSA